MSGIRRTRTAFAGVLRIGIEVGRMMTKIGCTWEAGVAVPDADADGELSEICSRSTNDVDIALVWRQRDNEAFVVVVDRRTTEAFVLDVHEDDNALDMFHHPFAYAAHRSCDHGWPAQPQVSLEGANR
jgi:hypothetical protein